MNNHFFSILFLCILSIAFYSCDSSNQSTNNIDSEIVERTDCLYPDDLMYFSQDFFLAVRYEEPTGAFIDTLSKLDPAFLKRDLNTFGKSLSFWINIYNALVQVKILNDGEAFKDQFQFFKNKDLVVAGESVSLDEIEHGILRLKQCDNELVNKFRLDSLDYRIHFTMNCGAASCPAIAYYRPETIQEDLHTAEKLFVEQTSSYDTLSNVLEISQLFEWFKDDFGGEEGIYKLMAQNGVINDNARPSIHYKPYNWELKSRNYQ